jgi:hypothetical protein
MLVSGAGAYQEMDYAGENVQQPDVHSTPAQRGAGMKAPGEVGLWLRWVLANAAAEAAGLGITALVGISVFSSFGEETGILVTLVLAALAVAAGTLVEGTVVGTAQWLVLRDPLPGMRWRTWVVATAAGAFVAWTLGMVPSTVFSLGAEPAGGSASPEPGDLTILGLAFLMGLVLGPVLGFAQWLALRRFVGSAALWMPANALAWAFGMVVIFTGIDLATSGSFGPGTVIILAATLACAGAVVGAIHGLVLVWMLRTRKGSG